MAQAGGRFNTGRRGNQNRDFIALVGATGFVAAFVVIVAVYLHLSRAPSYAGVPVPEQAAIPGIEVLVPVENLQVGTSFQPNMFRTEAMTEDQITPDMIRSFDELKGMYAKGVLVKNQPVIRSVLTNRQPVHILTAMLPKRYRAVALQVEKPLLDNVDGWAQPGTDVDVVWVTDAFGKETASVLVGPVRVLAANKATENSPAPDEEVASQGPSSIKSGKNNLVTVTLLLSVKDALRVSLAAANGTISLGLRGQGDRNPNEAGRPISSVIEREAPLEPARPVLNVKVRDPISRASELRQYDPSGRRIAD